MVVIRLARGGAKKSPFYNIVVTDSRKRRDSGYLERIGYFNPRATVDEVYINLNKERIVHWVQQGAKMSERVKNLVKNADQPRPQKKLKKVEEVKKVDDVREAAIEKAVQNAIEKEQSEIKQAEQKIDPQSDTNISTSESESPADITADSAVSQSEKEISPAEETPKPKESS